MKNSCFWYKPCKDYMSILPFKEQVKPPICLKYLLEKNQICSTLFSGHVSTVPFIHRF